MSGTRFATCYRCGETFEDVDTIIDAGGGWCPTCDARAERDESLAGYFAWVRSASVDLEDPSTYPRSGESFMDVYHRHLAAQGASAMLPDGTLVPADPCPCGAFSRTSPNHRVGCTDREETP